MSILEKEKRQFIEEYIAKVEQAVKAYNEADTHTAEQLQNNLLDYWLKYVMSLD